MKNILFILALASIFSACQSNVASNSEKSIEEIKSDSKITNSSIVRNPVSANGPLDTVNVAKMVFEETTFDFGEVNEGDMVSHVYRFTNTGKVPLLISNARSTCGCTVPSWPKEPIAPGGKGTIEVEFNTKSKFNKQSKPVTITANTYPATSKVFLTGFVNKNDSANAASAEKQ